MTQKVYLNYIIIEYLKSYLSVYQFYYQYAFFSRLQNYYWMDSQMMDSLRQTQRNLNSKQQQSKHKTVQISFKNISYSVEVEDQQAQYSLPFRKKYIQKKLLDNVSGHFQAGKVTAIMGASGAGKTTLFNVLACRVPKKFVEGQVYANNTEYDHQNFGYFANYVMQSDILMETLTVRQTLQFAANLKLNISKDEKHERIATLCKKLKLQNCLDVIVGGPILKGARISGGQKKRTSIAFELISDPQVLMLDEPTSGLDSLTSFIIVQYMKNLAVKQNKTIIMTIHQPNSQIFALFDKLMLLIQGKLIYQGSAKDAAGYFSTNFNLKCPEFHNPADFYLSIMHHESEQNKERFPQYFQRYRNIIMPSINIQIENRNIEQIQKKVIDVPFTTSFGTLINRDIKNTCRNPMMIKLRFLQTIFISIFAGGLYYRFTGDYKNKLNQDALVGFFFIMSISSLMFTLIPVQLIFPSQKNVFVKEQNAKLYSTLSYFLSRNVIEIPYSIVFPLLQSLIMYWFVGLNSTAQQFFTFYFITYQLAFCGSSFGLMLGSIVQDQKSMSVITPIIVLPLLIYSGLFKNFGNMSDWIAWIQYLSPVKYAFIGFFENEVLYAQNGSNIGRFNFDISLWISVALLASLGIGLRLMSLFFLWFLRTRLQ